MDRRPEYRFQQLEKKIDNTTMSSTVQRQQRKYRQNRRMQHRTRKIAMATTKQQRIESNRIRKPQPERRKKNPSMN